MIFLQKENFDASLHFLKKAEILCQNSLTFRALTYNNMALFFRRTNKLKQALSFLQKALDIELQMENPQSLADTHLNMCAVLSQLGKHKEALQHVLLSITLLQDEFLNLGSPDKNIDYEKKDEDNPKGNIEDRVSVLAIAYHNLGVELEYLKRYQEAIQTYSKAVKFSIENLGEKHQLVENLQKVLEAATAQIEAQKVKDPKSKEAKKEESKIQQKNFRVKKLYNPSQSANQRTKSQQKEKNAVKNYQDENLNLTKNTKNFDEPNRQDIKKEKGKDTRSDDESLI